MVTGIVVLVWGLAALNAELACANRGELRFQPVPSRKSGPKFQTKSGTVGKRLDNDHIRLFGSKLQSLAQISPAEEARVC